MRQCSFFTDARGLVDIELVMKLDNFVSLKRGSFQRTSPRGGPIYGIVLQISKQAIGCSSRLNSGFKKRIDEKPPVCVPSRSVKLRGQS